MLRFDKDGDHEREPSLLEQGFFEKCTPSALEKPCPGLDLTCSRLPWLRLEKNAPRRGGLGFRV